MPITDLVVPGTNVPGTTQEDRLTERVLTHHTPIEKETQ